MMSSCPVRAVVGTEHPVNMQKHGHELWWQGQEEGHRRPDGHKSMKERAQNAISACPTLLLNQQRPDHFIIIIKNMKAKRNVRVEYFSKLLQMLGAIRMFLSALHCLLILWILKEKFALK